MIKELKNNDTFNNQTFLIKNVESKITKTGNDFLKITFCDHSGELTGNLWDTTDEDTKTFTAGTIVNITGAITSYKDQLQVKIDNIQVNPQAKLADYLPSAPENQEELIHEFINYVNYVQNPIYKTIIHEILHTHQKAFFQYPAAKSVHHNFLNGLMFHTISILRQCNHLCDQYPQINRELLYSGAILHDIGKTVELSGVLNTEYTTNGKLLGHISIIDGEINRVAEKNNIPSDNPDLVLLRHMVLSHHGQLAYGSPIEPQLLEAAVLHHVDALDATINTISNNLSQTDKNQWTEKIWSQGNHQFYNH